MTEKNIAKLCAILLFLSILCMSFSYFQNYPVSLNENDETANRFNPIFWTAMGISFSLILFFLLYSRNIYLHLLCITLFLIIFTSPSLFYWLEGSDAAGGFFGLMNTVESHGLNSISSKSYSQWPIFLIFNLIISELTYLDLNIALKISIISIIIVIASNYLLYLSSVYKALPPIGIMVYFMISYIFLNWQAVPQTFAFALFFVLLNLLNSDGRYRALCIITFISLVFTHAFVSIWFIFFLIILYFSKNKDRNFAPSFALPIIIQITAIIFFAKIYFKSLMNLFIGYSTMLQEEEMSQGQSVKFVSSSISSGQSNIIDSIIQHIAQLNIILLALIIIVSLAVNLKGKKISDTELGLFSAGALHFILGSFLSVLGVRSLQLSMLPLANQTKSLSSQKYKYLLIILLTFVCLFYPCNLIRSNYTNTHYINEVDIYGFDFIKNSLHNETRYQILAAGVDVGFLSNSEGNIKDINPRVLQNFNYTNDIEAVLFSRKLAVELELLPHPTLFDEKNLSESIKFEKILNTNNHRLYIK